MLIAVAALITIAELVAALGVWLDVIFWVNLWALLGPALLVPGLLVSVVRRSRLKWRLMGILAVGVLVGVMAGSVSTSIVIDRGVRRDMSALQEAWAAYQAGALDDSGPARLHWYTRASDDPLVEIRWGGFIDYDYGSVFVPDGHRPLCDRFTGWCECTEVERRFYFCRTDP